MKKPVVDRDLCIGCGICVSLAPKVFELADVSKVKKDVDFKKYEEEINESIENCPVQAIIWEEGGEEDKEENCD